ncbi:MAG: MFS transporter, partial [Chloroflexi bacterium]|nr:MFS transporter [Chloroflexota bacterium]
SGSVHLAIYLQTVRGLDAIGAALVLTPWPLTAAVLFPRAGPIVARIGPERTMIGSLIVAAVAAGLMVGFDRSTPLVVVSAVAALGGVPLALGVTASTMRALAEFPPHEAGVASGVFNSLRQVGSSLGVAIPAAAFDLASGDDPLGGSTLAFAARALGFAFVVVIVALILPNRHRIPLPDATDASTPADDASAPAGP